MIPVGPIIAAAVIAARATRQGRRPQQAQQTGPEGANFLVRVFAWVALLVLLAELSAPLRWLASGVFGVLMFPATFLAYVLVPLRLPRVAYHFALLSPPITYSREIRGSAVFFGALAAVRSDSDSEVVSWLEERLAKARTVRGTTVAAAALLAAARGRTEAARLLFEAVDSLEASRPPRGVRAVARSWLVADAARGGDWTSVAEIGRRPRSYLRWPHAMGSIAQRIAAAPGALGDGWLWLYWALAPHRRATLPLLRRALDVAPVPDDQPTQSPDADEPRAEPSALGEALRQHADCLATPTPERLTLAGRAWDVVRDAPETRALLERRALGLGSMRPAEATLCRLLETAERDLAVHAAVLPRGLESKSQTLEAAASRARRRELDEIQDAAAALRDRTNRRAGIHPLEEWAAWTSLRLSCERVSRQGGTATRRAVFAAVYAPACNWAVWLFNMRLERLLAHHVFRWLLVEAQLADDAQAVALLEKNVKSGHGG